MKSSAVRILRCCLAPAGILILSSATLNADDAPLTASNSIPTTKPTVDPIGVKRRLMLKELSERFADFHKSTQPYIDRDRVELRSKYTVDRQSLENEIKRLTDLQKSLQKATFTVEAMTRDQIDAAAAPFGGISEEDINASRNAKLKFYDDDIAEIRSNTKRTGSDKAASIKADQALKADIAKTPDFILAEEIYIAKTNSPNSGNVFEGPFGRPVSGHVLDLVAAQGLYNSIWESWLKPQTKRSSAAGPTDGRDSGDSPQISGIMAPADLEKLLAAQRRFIYAFAADTPRLMELLPNGKFGVGPGGGKVGAVHRVLSNAGRLHLAELSSAVVTGIMH